MTTKQITGNDIGCWIDASCDSADTCNQRTVETAVEYGMVLSDDDKKLLTRFDHDVTKEDDSQWLSELGDDAVSFLNGLDLPSYCYFEFEDNSLFLLPSVENAKEDVGFISGGEDADLDDSDYPAADFRGEWLHVSDHGNATLYCRNDDGKDTEIWSIV
jgi:hypothetical protein